jgi:hypothetical protein
MKRLISIVLSLVLLAAQVPAQAPEVTTATLFLHYDITGEGVDVDDIVTATLPVDSAALTLLKNPDIPRVISVSLVDADDSVSAGSVVLVGTGADGGYLTETISGIGSAAGADVDSSTASFATITTATTGVFTGEGAGDTISVGVTATPPYQFPILQGVRQRALIDVLNEGFGDIDRAFSPEAVYKPLVAVQGARLVTVGSSTTVSSLAATANALLPVDINDLIQVQDTAGNQRLLQVVTNADNDTITVDQAVRLGTTGVSYKFWKLVNLNGARSGWFGVDGATQFSVFIDVVNYTANITYKLECIPRDTFPGGVVFAAFGPTAVANGSEADIVMLEAGDWRACRLGFQFDSADGGTTDDISAFLTVRR